MARLILELTNRCDLRCPHCFDDRHAATGDASLALVETILAGAKSCGIDQIVFTGGEPTVHRQFATIVGKVADAGYGFGLVTNGRKFEMVADLALRHRAAFRGVTFSLDGAREATHDRSRGRGSFRRVMRAATRAFFSKLPFTLNMVLTTQNRDEVAEMVDLAARVGSRGIRFGHLMFTSDHPVPGLVLSPAERREIEREIWALRPTAPVPVDIAAGYFSESPFFACGPLALEEYNVDYRGNLTLCCQLSGSSGANAGSDVMGNLGEIPLSEAVARFRRHAEEFVERKRRRVDAGALTEADHFPCWYCVKDHGKADAPMSLPVPGWSSTPFRGGRRLDVIACAPQS